MPGGVEAVHRLVQDQQLGVGQQATSDAEPLPHAKRITADTIVGPGGETHPLEDRRHPRGRAAIAYRRRDPQVLAAGEVKVKAGLFDDRSDPRQCHFPAGWHRHAKQPEPCRTSGLVRPSTIRITVVLPAPLGPSSPNAHPAGTRRSSPATASRFPNLFTSAAACKAVSAFGLFMQLTLVAAPSAAIRRKNGFSRHRGEQPTAHYDFVMNRVAGDDNRRGVHACPWVEVGS